MATPEPVGGHIVRRLDVTGDGTGSSVMAIDSSGAGGTVFRIRPAGGEAFSIARIIISIEDAGAPAPDEFGAAVALTNGCRIGLRDHVEDTVNYLDGGALKANRDVTGLCFDVVTDAFIGGGGARAIVARFSFNRFGSPLTLYGAKNQELIFHCQDNLTVLTSLFVVAEGQRLEDVPWSAA